MMSWMQRKPYASPIVSGPYHLLHPFPMKSAPRRQAARDKLPGDFPDYCVFVTKHSLLAFTTSLTDVSTEAHSYFVQLNYAFAMERMMRTFAPWAMPGMPAPSAPMAVLQSWFPAVKPAPKALPYFAAQRSHPLMPSIAAPQTYTTPQDVGQSATSAYNAMMAFSTAWAKAAPAAMDAWRLSTPR